MGDFMERSWWVIIPAAIVAVGIALLLSVALVWVIPWYGLLSGFFLIGVLAMWGAIFYDMFRRTDVSWLQIALWTVFLFVLPIISVLVYVFSRPDASTIRYKGEQVA